MRVSNGQPTDTPDPWNTRKQIAGFWVDYKTSDGEPTAQQVLDISAPSPAVITQRQRTEAKATINTSNKTAVSKLLRAIADASRDSDNVTRAWITSFKAATAGASTFAAFKTAVAGLGNLPPITTAQVLTAIANRIDDGTVD